MKYHGLLALTALGTYPGLGGAQLLSYVTAVITECPDASETDAATTVATDAIQSESDKITYSMPSCGCGCPTCTFTSVYSTEYPVFCSTGLSQQQYTITETYAGMSTLPTFAEPTEVPYGFTVVDATCTICGDAPLTTAITCPSGGATYNSGLPTPVSSAQSLTVTDSASLAATTDAAASSLEAAGSSVATESADSISAAAAVTAGTPVVAGTADDDAVAAATAAAAAAAAAGNTAADSTDTSTITKTLAQIEAQSHSNNPTSTPVGPGTHVPVQVSGASTAGVWLSPILFVVGLVTAQMVSG